MTKKKLPKKTAAVAIAAIVLGSVTLACASFQIAYEAADAIECWKPSYAKEDISLVLDKDTLSEEDYSLLYAQTGLTKIGIDRARNRGAAGKTRVLQIQDDYFAEHKVVHAKFAPYICTCTIGQNYITNIYLEDGDVLVTSSTQIAGWRMGHAGLVTSGLGEQVLQANAVGETSRYGNIYDYFTNRVTFMVLSPKTDKETKQKVVDFAQKNMVGLDYNPLHGIFDAKNSLTTTHCSHLVWYAYKQFGIDLDPNGGGIVSPQDLANSPEMELVQVFGFDPQKLWN